MQAANLAQKVLECVDDMDIDGFLTFLADNAHLRFGNSAIITGKQQIVQTIGDFFQNIKALKHRILHTWSDHQSIVCQGEITYTRTDDSQITIPFVNIWMLQAEHIEDYLIYIDLAPLYA